MLINPYAQKIWMAENKIASFKELVGAESRILDSILIDLEYNEEYDDDCGTKERKQSY